MTRPSIDPARHARESLHQAIAHGWTSEGVATDYAVECLIAADVPRDEARKLVQRVWDERFKVWGVC